LLDAKFFTLFGSLVTSLVTINSQNMTPGIKVTMNTSMAWTVWRFDGTDKR
jgi:hypothetical protein